eukprot:Gb_01587 [translate_table: standard]
MVFRRTTLMNYNADPNSCTWVWELWPPIRWELGLPQFFVWCLEEFEQYAEKAKTLPATTTDSDKLILYGLYKQATVGKVNTWAQVVSPDFIQVSLRFSRPGMFNLRDKAKWDAWKAVEGGGETDKSQEAAMEDYITNVKQLQEAA